MSLLIALDDFKTWKDVIGWGICALLILGVLWIIGR